MPPGCTVNVVELKLTMADRAVELSEWVSVPPVSTMTVPTTMVDVLSCVKVPPFWMSSVEPEKGFEVDVWTKLPPDPIVSEVRPSPDVPLFRKVPDDTVSVETPVNEPLLVTSIVPRGSVPPPSLNVPPAFTVRLGRDDPPPLKDPPEATASVNVFGTTYFAPFLTVTLS